MNIEPKEKCTLIIEDVPKDVVFSCLVESLKKEYSLSSAISIASEKVYANADVKISFQDFSEITLIREKNPCDKCEMLEDRPHMFQDQSLYNGEAMEDNETMEEGKKL